MTNRVLIIGAGASGMMAAIQAARAGAEVTVLEHKDRVGKKLLSTGNGRCNLTNRYQEEACYRCGQAGFVREVLRQFSVEDTLEFFKGLGILPKDRNGYIYPNSDQASSVLEVLRMEMEHLGIRVLLNCRIADIQKTGKDGNAGFSVRTNQGEVQAERLILAAGSKAAPVTGSDGSGYELARLLGHRIVTPLPALVQLRCGEKHYKQLAGIRTDAKITLFASEFGNSAGREHSGGRGVAGERRERDGRKEVWTVLAKEQGELQLTDYGISGIPAFQVSRYASVALHKGQKVKAVIDFLPQMETWEAEKMLRLRRRQMDYKTAEEWMTGLLNKKLGLVLLKLSGISPQQNMAQVTETQWAEMMKNLKEYETIITGTNPFENAQVCCGGVDVAEVTASAMESRKVPGLYFAGEILDVDGICGGYNLQWAWSSGAAAGRHAAGRQSGQDEVQKRAQREASKRNTERNRSRKGQQ